VVSWLQLPAKKRPHLVLWYLDEPDHVGHLKGPFADETKLTVERLDSLVGVFCRKVNQLPNADSINLVFLSDHGMGQITKTKSIALAEFLRDDWVENIRGGNPVIMLKPFEQYADTVWHVLSSIPHMKVYSKETMPDVFHYNESNRILDYVCVADSAYALYWKNTRFTDGGTHGYDPANTDVHAIFYGVGPAFKAGYQSPAFPNVDLYPLFAKIMNLDPAQTDGNPDEVVPMLKE
jgi:alkaline phosphatase D